MQTPGSSVPPLRAAAVTDDLYKNPAHVCKQNVAGLVGVRQPDLGLAWVHLLSKAQDNKLGFS